MLSRRSLFVLSAITATFVAATPMFAAEPKSKIGIGFVPFLRDGDDTEQAMHAMVGQFPQVHSMYNPNTPDDLFGTLRKLKKAGKTVDFIVIAGHGSKAQPSIGFRDRDLGPEDVDLPALRKLKDIAERAAKNPANPDKKGAEAALEKIRQQLADIEAISEVMAPGGTVVMINCSPAATDAGMTFVKNLAEVLMGKNGGTIIASKSDVQIGQVKSVANYLKALISGERVAFGDFFVTGDWVTHQVKPSNRTTGGNHTPRDLTKEEVAEALKALGFEPTILDGANVRVRAFTKLPNGLKPGGEQLIVHVSVYRGKYQLESYHGDTMKTASNTEIASARWANIDTSGVCLPGRLGDFPNQDFFPIGSAQLRLIYQNLHIEVICQKAGGAVGKGQENYKKAQDSGRTLNDSARGPAIELGNKLIQELDKR